MFQKLKDKWKVNGTDFLLIFFTFAIGGSLCGIAGKKIMSFTGIDKGLVWLIVYIIILTIIWPLCVLLISIPFGQFRFFKKFIGKILARFTGQKPDAFSKAVALAGQGNPGAQTNMAIFASGAGSNAAKIISHFKNNPEVKVALVVCNKPGAGVLQIAANNGIPILIIERERLSRGDGYVQALKQYNIQWIILAGFLWKLPVSLVHAWPGHIINIHPALLPNYGGKGMYGKYVHEAVLAAGDKKSGISIHYVDEIYDHGEVIKQAYCEIGENETPDSLAAKIHLLEHEHFSGVIEQEIRKKRPLTPKGEPGPGRL